MVHRTVDSESDCHFVIRPNRSATWKQTLIFFLVLSAVCLAVAGLWAAQGFWPVLPFAGLELGLLGAALYRVSSASERTEVVSVRGATVAIEKGRDRPLHRWEFERAWATVSLCPSRHRWYPTRLVIRSHGREVGLAAFLNEEERTQLAGDLRRAIRPC
jgi:uncharacterized membrane protein